MLHFSCYFGGETMILRRIQLVEAGYIPADCLHEAFKDELRLWFDGFTDEKLKTLDDFLEDKYQLRAEVEDVSSVAPGLRIVEFANQSLYWIQQEGNLCVRYNELYDELLCRSEQGEVDIEKQVRQEMNDHKLMRQAKFGDLGEYHNAFLDYADRVGKQAQLKFRGETLRAGSSVAVEILPDLREAPDGKPHLLPDWEDAPKDYVPEMPLTSAMVRLLVLPYTKQKDTVKELRNMLLGECEMKYETPRHKEVLDAVLKGDLKEYNRCALFEHRRGERGFGESGERERRGVESLG